MRRIALLALVLSLGATSALAADPVCSKLAWPLDKERALLNGATRSIASGAPLVLQIENAPADHIAIAITPAPKP